MSFQLNSVVPWGRNLSEYSRMFGLDESAASLRIADFGGGPSSFNCEAARRGCAVTSYDPIYQFSEAALRRRIGEVRVTVMRQMRENMENYVWTDIKSPDELEAVRMSAMETFLADYEQGKKEGRYVSHSLPDRLPCADGAYDLGLSSHFLLMYTALGYDFHVRAISEMLRACREVRIFPIVDLDARKTELTAAVIRYFRENYSVAVQKTGYEFQKGENQVLIIRKKPAGEGKLC